MSESKQYKSLFIMCSELRAEIKSLRQEMKDLRESKSSCQHECNVNAVEDEDEEICENPNQEIFDNISTDMNNIVYLWYSFSTQTLTFMVTSLFGNYQKLLEKQEFALQSLKQVVNLSW